MNRIKELEHDIKLYLKDSGESKDGLFTPSDIYGMDAWLTNLMNLTLQVSTITIELIEDSSDRWGVINTYKKVEDSNMGYTIILNNSAERLDIQSVKDLAVIIDDYETLAKKMTLTFNG